MMKLFTVGKFDLDFFSDEFAESKSKTLVSLKFGDNFQIDWRGN